MYRYSTSTASSLFILDPENAENKYESLERSHSAHILVTYTRHGQIYRNNF